MCFAFLKLGNRQSHPRLMPSANPAIELPCLQTAQESGQESPSNSQEDCTCITCRQVKRRCLNPLHCGHCRCRYFTRPLPESETSHGAKDQSETIIPLKFVSLNGRRRHRAWGISDKVRELANPELHNMRITTTPDDEETNNGSVVCTIGDLDETCHYCRYTFKKYIHVTQAMAEAVLQEEHESELRMHPKEATARQILGTVGGAIDCPRCYSSYYSKIIIPKHVALHIHQYCKEQTEYEKGIRRNSSAVSELRVSTA